MAHTMSKYILGVVGVIIIVAAVIFLRTDKPLSDTTASINLGITKSVTYTDDGFVPDILTVKAGETVTFVNESSSPLWVASALHPTHTLYPEFDNKYAVPKGGSYSFIFTKVGTHPYHNHVLLGKFGKVIVE